ncbi:MAG TPA: phenylalanine--tRNA ligase subunit alpha, partial [Saprospiraceae bacterium]|nr:phenylalanine--tRNA ligase subunit alpha [Saprospiraceae bacterium]
MSQDWFLPIKQVIQAIQSEVVSDAATLERFRIQYLGSKNILKPLFGEIAKVPNELK